MSPTLETPAPVRPSTSPSQRLRTTTVAVRVSLRWLGVRKTLTAEQKALAANAFDAEGAFLSAGKKLLDTSHPAFRAASSIKGRIIAFWKGMSLPYPEPGIRLIRQDKVETFDAQMRELQQELAEAVRELERHYEDLKAAARMRLGSLYNPADYPASLAGMFEVSWDFPSVEPPDYLRELHPELYRRECERAAARFDEAVRLAEQAFIEELHGLVAHLTERLTGEVDGKPKVFRDSAVGHLRAFFDRFGELNVRSNEELDRLVEDCRSIVRGVEPERLRRDLPLRQAVAEELNRVQDALDDLLVDRPRRNILRRAR